MEAHIDQTPLGAPACPPRSAPARGHEPLSYSRVGRPGIEQALELDAELRALVNLPPCAGHPERPDPNAALRFLVAAREKWRTDAAKECCRIASRWCPDDATDGSGRGIGPLLTEISKRFHLGAQDVCAAFRDGTSTEEDVPS
jgi:hypothetical protein